MRSQSIIRIIPAHGQADRAETARQCARDCSAACEMVGTLALLGPLHNADGNEARQNGGTTALRLSQLQEIGARTGVDIRHVDPDKMKSTEDLAEALVGCEAIIPYAKTKLTPELVRQLPALKLVQLMSAGFDHIDVEALNALGVDVANNGGFSPGR